MEDVAKSCDRDIKEPVPELQALGKVSVKKNERASNVKEHFIPIQVPKDSIHIVKSMGDWEEVAEQFLTTVKKTRVVGYHSIYQLTSSKEQGQHLTCILQFSVVGGPILIFQLNQLPNLPASLKDVLADSRILKVGVNVYNLARRLEKDHDLIVAGTLDLRAVCEKIDFPERLYMSLPDMSKAFLEKDLAIVSGNSKSISARVTYWHRNSLREDQVHYASVFPYAALQIFIDMINIKVDNFKSTISDKGYLTETWVQAEELWRDFIDEDRKFTAFYCEICDVSPGVQQSYDSHLAGARHRKSVDKLLKMEQYGELGDAINFNNAVKSSDGPVSDTGKEKFYDPSLWCSICKVGMPGTEAMKQHMVGQKHKKRVKQKIEAGEEISENPQASDQDQEPMVVSEKTEFTCDICNLTVPTQASMEFHLNGKKHKKLVARKQAQEGLEGLEEADAGIENYRESDNSRRYCEACEIEVHNNHNWLLHIAGKSHKKNKEKLDQLAVLVSCNSDFGAKRPTVNELSGSVYCGICNTTVMASKENLDSHFQGKKHQMRLKVKSASDSKTEEAPKEVNLTPRMVDIAKAVVGKVSGEDVGTHETGIYCKVCRTFLFGGKDALQSHLRGKKHLKNQQVIGKHKQPFKFPKARTQPYHPPRPQQPWQNSDIDDSYEIPGVPATHFDNPNRGRGFAPRGSFNNRGGRGAGFRGRGTLNLQLRGRGRGFGQNPGGIVPNRGGNVHNRGGIGPNQGRFVPNRGAFGLNRGGFVHNQDTPSNNIIVPQIQPNVGQPQHQESFDAPYTGNLGSSSWQGGPGQLNDSWPTPRTLVHPGQLNVGQPQHQESFDAPYTGNLGSSSWQGGPGQLNDSWPTPRTLVHPLGHRGRGVGRGRGNSAERYHPYTLF